MMPHALQTDSLQALKAWARQHCRNAIHDAIRDTDHPLSWEECDEVEARMMLVFERIVAHLTVELLRNVGYMNCLIDQIVTDTVGLLKASRRQRA